MTMELIEVEAFVAAVRTGTLTRAAVELHVSQPAISRRLDLLERELGAPLLERTAGGVRLTAAGTALLPYARRILAARTDGIAAVRDLELSAGGAVSLALVGTLAGTALPRRLQRFRAEHPAVRLLPRTARSDEVSRLVREGEAQIGLRYLPDPHPDVVVHVIGDERLVVVCAAGMPAADGATDPTALVGIPWVTFPPTAGGATDAFARLLERRRIQYGLDGSDTIAIDSLTAQKRMVEAGFGLGLVPVSSITEELRLGTLQRLNVPELEASVPVVAIHRRRGYLSAAARALLRALLPDETAAGAPPDPLP